MRILLVDDDDLILDLMTASLAAVGFGDLQTANSAADAIRIVQSDRSGFDLITLDIEMPGVDGIELCRWLRAQPRYVHTPILMVTARSESAHVDRAFAAGATDYLTKPFELNQLCAAVSRAVGVQRGEDSGSSPSKKSIDEPERSRRDVGFSMPVPLRGIARVSSYRELVMQVVKARRVDLLSSVIFALKIRGIGLIYTQCNSEEFVALLSGVARAIVSSLADREFTIAYAGEGVFVCMLRAESTFDPSTIVMDVNAATPVGTYTDRSGRPLDVKLHVGAHPRGGPFRSKRRVLDLFPSIIRSAVDDAHRAFAADRRHRRA